MRHMAVVLEEFRVKYFVKEFFSWFGHTVIKHQALALQVCTQPHKPLKAVLPPHNQNFFLGVLLTNKVLVYMWRIGTCRYLLKYKLTEV